MNQRPTLRDVASAAGVSTYVASRSLNDGSGVAPATRDHVRRVSAEIGYVRNNVAAGLRTQSSHVVGVLTASGRNQYYTMLAEAINTELRGSGYFIVTNDAIRDHKKTSSRERESVRMILEQRPAVIVSTYALRAESLRRIVSLGIPVIFADNKPNVSSAFNLPYVGSDNHQIGYLASDYLGCLGHKRILVMSFPETWSTAVDRLAGIRDAAKKWGVNVEISISESNPDRVFRAALTKLRSLPLTNMPDGLIALNTIQLLGAYRALRELNMTVGKDISVVAVDDFDWAPFLTPALTVVSQNIKEIARQTAHLVLTSIKGESTEGKEVIIPVKLIERDSCSHQL